MPPARVTLGVEFHAAGLSIEPELIAAGARSDVFESETETAGYLVGNLKASYTIPRQHFSHHLAMEFFNIGDTLYRNQVSFIKDLAPEIGRGARFSYTVKFF
jgi:iron complex outermembrane receptor protein